MVATPNGNWSGTFIPGMNKIVFAEWNKLYITTKRVIITYDMYIKVLLGKVEISLDCVENVVQDFKELENVIKVVHGLTVCRGIKMISSYSSTGLTPTRKPGQKKRNCK